MVKTAQVGDLNVHANSVPANEVEWKLRWSALVCLCAISQNPAWYNDELLCGKMQYTKRESPVSFALLPAMARSISMSGNIAEGKCWDVYVEIRAKQFSQDFGYALVNIFRNIPRLWY